MKLKTLCILTIGMLVYQGVVAAEDTCKVKQSYPNKTFLVEVNKNKMLAITSEMAANQLKLKAEIDALKKQIAAKDELMASLQGAKTNYDTVVDYQRTYITELEKTKDGYKSLAKDYKKLAGEPWLTFDVGLGATGSDTSPAAFVGVGIRRIRMWGFVQENNSGVIFGASLPMF